MQLTQLKQRFGETIQIGVTLAAGIVLIATALKPQPIAPVGPVWEYTSVTGSPSMPFGNDSGASQSMICYSGLSGCRMEKGTEGMMAAAAKLGEKGWELACVTISGESNRERVMYFKRLRSVLNRGDSPGSR
jgi:hypothetical protein